MLQSLVLTAAILMTIWSLMGWFVYVVDWHQRIPSRMNIFPTALTIMLWVIYYHL